MKTSFCATTCSSVEKVVPSGVAISYTIGKLKRLQSFLESIKVYNNSYSNYKREEILKLKSPLYLMLGSLCSGGKWILFFVDRVNVKLLQNFSPWITDGVARLLSNEISKGFRQNLNSSSLCRRVELLVKLIFLSWKIWPLFNSSSSYL